jgi:hypothetical protein
MSVRTEQIYPVGGAEASAKNALASTPPTIKNKSK